MQRVSLNNHWVIPKRILPLKIARPLSILVIGIGLSMIYSSTAYGTTPEQATDKISRDLYLTILGGAIILGLILSYVIRCPNEQPQIPQLDQYQIAYLAGGDSRAVDLAITQLVYQGYLRPNMRNRTFAIEKQLPPEAPNLEQQVMRQVHRTATFKDLRSGGSYETDFLRSALEQEKLLMTGWAAWMGSSFALFLSAHFCILPISFIISYLNFKLSSDVYTFMMRLYYGVGLFTFCCVSWRTRRGSRVLADIRRKHDAYNVIQRVALYGYAALSGGALDDLKQIVAAQEKEDTAGGCGCGC